MTACVVWDNLMDPVGLGFEIFAAMAAYRTKDENNLPIDPSGTFDGKPFANAKELGTLLRNSTKTRDCLTRNVYRFAMGRNESGIDSEQIAKLAQAFTAGGQKFKALAISPIRTAALNT